ncbi:MAG TPA: protein kinase, partial [Planctomycetota bacterium]|nr:protein kinase [Planctomycetota bacterium]
MPRLPEIPGYALERFLGEGAYAKVYLAKEKGGLERPVALKVFSKENRRSYERELDMVKKIEELRRKERALEIVQALGSGEHEGISFIALEYLEAGSLLDRVVLHGPTPLETALGYVRDAASALSLLH